jgi:membrane protease YdiL (CAAX protease family)
MQPAPFRETWKLLGIAAVWLVLAKELVPLGDALVPDAWKAKIALRTFLMLCQVTTALAGVALCAVFLRRPREALALGRPRAAHLLSAALLSPALFCASSLIALRAALPTLLAELETRGAGATRENAGDFGRTLEQGPLLLTLLWGALLAAATEELLFRGALWSALRGLSAPVEARWKERGEVPDFVAPGVASRLGRAAVERGVLPTIVAAAVFAFLHGGMQGGVGIVRVVSALCLGLACGAGRQASGSLFVPVLLHFGNNTLAIGHGRGWFAGSGEPWVDGIQNPVVELAGAGAAVWIGLAIVRARTRPPLHAAT